jgi:two-component system, OmpR family, phosphate regulon sensor histidine kinase PhoR
LERIFEKFGRGQNGTGGRVSGAGLGLYVSRRIVRAHGSDLTVRSKPGAGSVFAFELEGVRESPER